jgi:hypothetical protein
MSNTSKEFDWFDKPKNRKLLWILLWTVCGLSVFAEFFVHRHPHFSFDGFFGFYAVLGFAACAVSILVAKGLGFLLKVKEDFYDHDPE